VLLEADRAATAFRIRKQTVTIGRLPECDVVVSDPGASRHHARIRVDGGEYVLTDLGSTNGTLVNDEPVQERSLLHGDRITIGTTRFEFRRE
jgi:pSer/pThr/pTyr-binding forkhead associated (FHA) protein